MKNLYLKEFTDYFNEQVSYHVRKKNRNYDDIKIIYRIIMDKYLRSL